MSLILHKFYLSGKVGWVLHISLYLVLSFYLKQWCTLRNRSVSLLCRGLWVLLHVCVVRAGGHARRYHQLQSDCTPPASSSSSSSASTASKEDTTQHQLHGQHQLRRPPLHPTNHGNTHRHTHGHRTHVTRTHTLAHYCFIITYSYLLC